MQTGPRSKIQLDDDETTKLLQQARGLAATLDLSVSDVLHAIEITTLRDIAFQDGVRRDEQMSATMAILTRIGNLLERKP